VAADRRQTASSWNRFWHRAFFVCSGPSPATFGAMDAAPARDNDGVAPILHACRGAPRAN